jgi:hypothetical protein
MRSVKYLFVVVLAAFALAAGFDLIAVPSDTVADSAALMFVDARNVRIT